MEKPQIKTKRIEIESYCLPGSLDGILTEKEPEVIESGENYAICSFPQKSISIFAQLKQNGKKINVMVNLKELSAP